MWRVVLVVLALCSCAVGKSIFDDDWVDPNPKKTDSTPHPVVPPPVKAPRQPRPVMKPAPDPAPASDPAPAPGPAPTPAAEPAIPVAPPLKDPPSDAALVDAKTSINEVYKEGFASAKTPESKAALSRTLLDAALTEKDDSARFALCDKARDLAVEAGDYPVAYAAIEDIGKSFRVDTLRMSLDLIKATAKTVHTPAQRKELVGGTGDIVDKAIAAGRYEIADAAAEMGMGAARANGSPTLIKDAAEIVKRAKQAEEAYADFQKASVILKANANDADANLTVGKFLCFAKGNWDTGLPFLAHGSDASLNALANKEAKGAIDSNTRVELADGWWELAKNEKDEPSTRQIKVRAIKWYTEALPELSGLMKTRVEIRLNALSGIKEGPAPGAATAGGSSGRPPEIVNAIARHDLVEGMTFQEACRAARLPHQFVSKSGNETTYRWTIKGRTGSHQEIERGVRTTYRMVADYGPIGYVEATFADDSLVSCQRVSNR